MTYFDHLLALFVAAIVPVAGYVSFQRLVRKKAAGESIVRTELYQGSSVTQWLLFLILSVLWMTQDRAFAELGFRSAGGPWFLVGVGLTIAGIALLVIQLRQIANADGDEIHAARDQLGRLEIIIPQKENELRQFYGLSLTAGIVEETLWRGFMIWYLGQLLPTWLAVTAGILGFGLAHAYQGLAHLPKVTLVGAVFTGLYFLSGSLWLPIVLHAATDVLQGRAGFEIIRRDSLATSKPGSEPGSEPGSDPGSDPIA